MTNPHAGDCRRAMAIIGHHSLGYPDGINAIIGEAVDNDRGTELFLAMLNAYQFIIPELRTESGMAALSAWVRDIAEHESDPDLRRAAHAIIGHAADDLEHLNTAITEAIAEGRTGPLIGAVLDMYGLLVPELRTPVCIAALSQWTARLSGQEV